MKRRGFLALLGMAPAAPMLAKQALETAPAKAMQEPIAQAQVLYGSADRIMCSAGYIMADGTYKSYLG